MPNCAESDLISAYIDNELSAAEIATLELHLAGCRSCREELRDLREVLAITGDAAPVPAPADLTAALLLQATHARAEAVERNRLRLPMWVGGLAAAASLVVWFGVREAASPAAIPLDTLLAAHNRDVTGTVHDQIQAAAAYSAALRRSTDDDARS